MCLVYFAIRLQSPANPRLRLTGRELIKVNSESPRASGGVEGQSNSFPLRDSNRFNSTGGVTGGKTWTKLLRVHVHKNKHKSAS